MTSSTFVLLDDSLSEDGTALLFEAPEELVICREAADVERALADIQKGLASGLFGAGFFSYELGYLMEPKLLPLLPEKRQDPLIWIGLFHQPRKLQRSEVGDWLLQKGGEEPHDLSEFKLSISREEYFEAFRKAQHYIGAGDVYQINLTFKYLFDFKGNPLSLYRDLRRQQPVAYGGLIAADDFHLLSLSPELFFHLEEGKIKSRPMKGTAPRGRTPKDDRELVAWLGGDEKSRAENLMIVDLLRNDLGRVAEIGSVTVSDLFTVETYRTIHQMTSGIEATLKADLSLSTLLGALFPCGSVTGAPKVRAMEIIRELEAHPRGPYTGAFGMLSPDGEMRFNVSIRTLMLAAGGRGEMGIGSGVVSDSGAEAEYQECLLKAEFLTRNRSPFQLIETLRWQQEGGFYLLDRHLERLQNSAAYFAFPFARTDILQTLDEACQNFTAATYMVRLLLNEEGELSLTSSEIELPAPGTIWTYLLSDVPTDSENIFFYHKTTKRELYTEEWQKKSRETGCDEVIFVNEKGELTEGSRTTVFLEKEGILRTPALSSGLLPGTLRQELIEDPSKNVREERLTPADLAKADRVFVGNSVRGLVEVRALEEN